MKGKIEKTKTKGKKTGKGIRSKVREKSTEMTELREWLDVMKEELLEAIREGFRENQNNYEEGEEKDNGGDDEKSGSENGEDENKEGGKNADEE